LEADPIPLGAGSRTFQKIAGAPVQIAAQPRFSVFPYSSWLAFAREKLIIHNEYKT